MDLLRSSSFIKPHTPPTERFSPRLPRLLLYKTRPLSRSFLQGLPFPLLGQGVGVLLGAGVGGWLSGASGSWVVSKNLQSLSLNTKLFSALGLKILPWMPIDQKFFWQGFTIFRKLFLMHFPSPISSPMGSLKIFKEPSGFKLLVLTLKLDAFFWIWISTKKISWGRNKTQLWILARESVMWSYFLCGVLTSSVLVAQFSFEQTFKSVTLIRAGVDNIFAASTSSISECARQFCLLLFEFD